MRWHPGGWTMRLSTASEWGGCCDPGAARGIDMTTFDNSKETPVLEEQQTVRRFSRRGIINLVGIAGLSAGGLPLAACSAAPPPAPAAPAATTAPAAAPTAAPKADPKADPKPAP